MIIDIILSVNKTLIIDVRESFEYKMGHVDGAINIPLSKIRHDTFITGVDRDTEVIVYCRTGHRSSMAIYHWSKMGFTKLVNGISAKEVIKNFKPLQDSN